jgi:uncharacterized protein YceK
MKNILTFAVICMLASVLSGCTTVVFESTKPDGTKVKTTIRVPAIGSRQFGDIDLTNGTVKGVRSQQSTAVELFEAGVEFGARAARTP